jgi:hypothetical protein
LRSRDLGWEALVDEDGSTASYKVRWRGGRRRPARECKRSRAAVKKKSFKPKK